MRFTPLTLTAILATLSSASLFAADSVGIFQFSRRSYDPSNPQATAVARDGTIESAVIASGDGSAGRVRQRKETTFTYRCYIKFLYYEK